MSNFSFSERGVVSPNVLQGTSRDPHLLGAAGGLRRGQARRHQRRLRLHLGPRRHPAVHLRLPRLPLQRHQPRRPLLRHPQRQPRPVEPRLLPPVGEGHEHGAEHVQRPQAERSSSPTTTARTSSSPATRRRSACTYNNDPRVVQVRQEPLPRPPRPGGRLPAALGQRRRTSAGPATATSAGTTSPTSSTGRSAATASTRSPTRRRRSTPRWPPSRFRTTATGPGSGPRSSGPRATTTPTTRTPPGFDSILDGPNFAGGPFSFWNRQQIPLFGVNLVQRLSLIPDLRSSKIQGQANFVNPGILLPNIGFDFDLTPKLKMINNANLLWFDQTERRSSSSSSTATSTGSSASTSSTGFEYRPAPEREHHLRRSASRP